jgi:YHS domain-containing protein
MGEVLLDIILVLVVSGALRKILQSAMTSMRAPQPSGERPRASGSVHMERDPVCGTFVVPGRAVSITVAGQHVYFCSQACCDRYRAHQRTA